MDKTIRLDRLRLKSGQWTDGKRALVSAVRQIADACQVAVPGELIRAIQDVKSDESNLNLVAGAIRENAQHIKSYIKAQRGVLSIVPDNNISNSCFYYISQVADNLIDIGTASTTVSQFARLCTRAINNHLSSIRRLHQGKSLEKGGRTHQGEACKPGWSASRTGCTPHEGNKPASGNEQQNEKPSSREETEQSAGNGGKHDESTDQTTEESASRVSETSGNGIWDKLGGAVTRNRSRKPSPAGRIPAKPAEVTKRLTRMRSILDKQSAKAEKSGDHYAAHGYKVMSELMDMVQEHIDQVGIEEAIEQLGPEKDLGDENSRQVSYEGVWHDEGHFIDDYLKMSGITTTHSTGGMPSPDLQMISSWTHAQLANVNSPYKERAKKAGVPADFIPPDPTIPNKLEEAKNIPGLETSEDIHKLVGKQVDRIDKDVFKKLDETYGRGKWIIKSYGAEAYAGFGIYFPERARQMQLDAKSDMIYAKKKLSALGYKINRDEKGDAVGLVTPNGEKVSFSSIKSGNESSGGGATGDTGEAGEGTKVSGALNVTKEVKKWATLAERASRNENGVRLPGSPEDELRWYGYQLKKDKGGKATGIEATDGSGVSYDFDSPEYEDIAKADESLDFWAGRAASTSEYYEKEKSTPSLFMAQPAVKAVGVSKYDRSMGNTWETATEARVHVITRNGKAEAIPYATFRHRSDVVPIVFLDKDARAAMKAAEDAVNGLPKSERSGQTYAPDVVKGKAGYQAIEANPEAEGGGSSWLGSNPFAIDAYVSQVVGREPAHVRFIRRLLTDEGRDQSASKTQPKRGAKKSFDGPLSRLQKSNNLSIGNIQWTREDFRFEGQDDHIWRSKPSNGPKLQVRIMVSRPGNSRHWDEWQYNVTVGNHSDEGKGYYTDDAAKEAAERAYRRLLLQQTRTEKSLVTKCSSGINSGKPGPCPLSNPAAHSSGGGNSSGISTTNVSSSGGSSKPLSRLSSTVSAVGSAASSVGRAVSNAGTAVYNELAESAKMGDPSSIALKGAVDTYLKIHHISETGYRAGQQLAKQLAKDICRPEPCSPESVERTAKVLSTLDTGLRWTQATAIHPLVESIGGPVAGFVASKAAYLTPTASLAYVGYCMLKEMCRGGDPIKLIKDARTSIKEAMKDQPDAHHKSVSDVPDGNNQTRADANSDRQAFGRKLLERMSAIHNDDDQAYYYRLICAALDETNRDYDKTIALSDKVFRNSKASRAKSQAKSSSSPQKNVRYAKSLSRLRTVMKCESGPNAGKPGPCPGQHGASHMGGASSGNGGGSDKYPTNRQAWDRMSGREYEDFLNKPLGGGSTGSRIDYAGMTDDEIDAHINAAMDRKVGNSTSMPKLDRLKPAQQEIAAPSGPSQPLAGGATPSPSPQNPALANARQTPRPSPAPTTQPGRVAITGEKPKVSVEALTRRMGPLAVKAVDKQVNSEISARMDQAKTYVDSLSGRSRQVVEQSTKDVWPSCPNWVTNTVSSVCTVLDVAANIGIAAGLGAITGGGSVAAEGAVAGGAAVEGTAAASSGLAGAVGGAVKIAAGHAGGALEYLNPPIVSMLYAATMSVVGGIQDKGKEGMWTAMSRKARERITYITSGEGNAG